MSESVRSDDSNLVTLEILIDGSVIPDTCFIHDVHIEHEINRIPSAQVSILDGSRAESNFALAASSLFELGANIEIKLGYHAKNRSVFKGLILRQNIRADPGGDSKLVLMCYDKAIKLTLARSSRQFFASTDSAIMTTLLTDAGLKADVESTTIEFEHQIQSFATDWDFLLSRAEANGQIVVANDGTVTVASPEFKKAKLKAVYGDSIGRVDLALDAAEQFDSIAASGWDPKVQKVVTETSTEPSVNGQGNSSGSKLAGALALRPMALQSPGNMSSAELKAWADAQLLKSRLARIRGTISFDGNSGIDPGDELDLDGLGKRFNGAGYVSAVRHQVSEGDWTTEVELGLPRRFFADANRDLNAAPAAGLKPAASGLQIGKVLQIHDDPQGERRVKVDMPLQGGGTGGIWVRNLSPYATRQAGIEFMPELDDELVIGFLDGDPGAGVVLGSLHSSDRPSSVVPDELNTIKAIVTNAQLKISFDDDRKIITIETPSAHKICLNDEEKTITLVDSNDNRVELDESGIALSSPKDISIKASGSIAIAGDKGVSIDTSAGDVSVAGMNVSIAAKTSLKAEGNASAELSAAGQTVVKGAMVMIN